jgi:hypothetical protein
MNTEIRIHPCDLWFRHSIGADRSWMWLTHPLPQVVLTSSKIDPRQKLHQDATLERKLHRQLHLPRIAHTLSQEPVKVE